MTDQRLYFGAFTIERRYDAAPGRVFRAFSDRELKQRWMGCEEVTAPIIETLDFRVGGREVSRGGGGDGAVHLFEGTYLDIVPDSRFVFAFVMHVGGRKLSASIASVEVLPDGRGARLIFNEQGVYLGEDGWAEREEGTAFGMDQLAAWLDTQKEAA
ncbi:SRPBCC family protein [Brevundimonas sp.]|uniref:SRPBCC family protein n=1 Tax=Brevundimonas sp. TaxID=1871086 RepID=UPI002D44AD94|nr:SRPBCC family protein [Brevundimonas sp.]HYD28038.1 SRPBCC family protein [Brevundimonas sp.]